MPEWLKALLLAHGLSGYADSLQTLAGTQLPYEEMEGRTAGNAAKVLRDKAGNPRAIGVTPFLREHFGDKNLARPGYKATGNTEQTFGEYVLGHEFGHVITQGQSELTLKIGETLGDDIPQTDEDNESLADDVQNTLTFLRKGTTDAGTLTPKQRKLMDTMLEQPIYKNHAINAMRGRVAVRRKP